MDDEIRDVAEFHVKFRLPVGLTGPKLLEPEPMQKRIDFIEEELEELIEARDKGDLPGIVDALADLTYVIKGTAVMLGISNSCWTDVWDEVHKQNMLKEPTGTDDYHFGVKKPAGWVPPDIDGILEGYKEPFK